jgi:hypothetical protein
MLAGLPPAVQCRRLDSLPLPANPGLRRLVNRGMDDALTADLPAAELVEVLVASRSLPGPHRDPRLVLVAGAVVASIAFGIASHAISADRTDPTPLAVASMGTDTDGTEADRVPGSTARPEVALGEAAGVQPARGATVVIAGSAQMPIRDAWLGVRAGRIVLGTRSADIEAGAFSIGVPVFAPNVPVTVEIEIRTTGPDGPLVAESSSSLVSRSAVDVWSIMTGRVGGTCRVTATGPAPVGLRAVDAAVTDRGASVAQGRSPIVAAGDSPAGESLHLGRWQFEASLPDEPTSPALAAVRTLRLELAWKDLAEGTSSELSIPFVSCGPTESFKRNDRDQ